MDHRSCSLRSVTIEVAKRAKEEVEEARKAVEALQASRAIARRLRDEAAGDLYWTLKRYVNDIRWGPEVLRLEPLEEERQSALRALRRRLNEAEDRLEEFEEVWEACGRLLWVQRIQLSELGQ